MATDFFYRIITLIKISIKLLTFTGLYRNQYICHFSFSGNAIAYSTAVFGEGTGSILMSRLKCEGTESNIGHCKSQGFGYGRVFCSHSQDAGVSCGKHMHKYNFPLYKNLYYFYIKNE